MMRKGPDQVDQIVGRNIRIYRLQNGLTQTELADQLDLTFQQVQKYEKGTNRVGSGRLLKIATFLGISVTALFKGSDEMADLDKQSIFDQLAKPHANRLLQAFARIDDDGLRRSVVHLVEEIANKGLARRRESQSTFHRGDVGCLSVRAPGDVSSGQS